MFNRVSNKNVHNKKQLFVVVIALIGVITITASQALGHTIFLEPENGNIAGNATKKNDSSASNNGYVQFGDNQSNSNLSANASRVLNYIKSIHGKYILSGQEEDNGPTFGEQQWLISVTGKKPAIRGFEMRSDSKDPIADMISSWQNGQIIQAQYHMGAPLLPDSFRNSQTEASIKTALTPGTPENSDFMAKLDWQAGRLQRLRDAGVPVIWRPWHEMTGDFFWWGPNSSNGNDAKQLKRLWIFTYNYYTQNKGLDNLIWNWNISSYPWVDQNYASYYPGDEYVDMLSMDEYAHQRTPEITVDQYTSNTLNSLRRLNNEVTSNKIVTIGENGLLPNIDTIFNSSGPKPAYFLTWWHCEADSDYPNCNPLQWVQEVYNNPRTITADELPSFK